MYLFHHEMLKTCFLCCLCIPINLLRLFLNLITVKIVESNLTGSKSSDFKISYIINISRIAEYSRNIRCNIRLPICRSKNHRTVFSCNINLLRILLKHNRECIRTTDSYHRMIDCIDRSPLIFFIIIVNKFYGNLCISL